MFMQNEQIRDYNVEAFLCCFSEILIYNYYCKV